MVSQLRKGIGGLRSLAAALLCLGLAQTSSAQSVAGPAAPAPAAHRSLDDGPMTSFTIHVVWADSGAPVPGAAVWIRGSNQEFLYDWTMSAATDEQGIARMHFPSSFRALYVNVKHALAAETDGLFGHATATAPALEAASTPLADPLTFKLERGARIVGTVRRASDGRPVADAFIEALPSSPPGPTRASRSGPDGKYSIDGLARGKRILRAIGAGGLVSDDRAPAPVLAAAGVESGPFDISLIPGGAVSGRVTDPSTGEPIAGATIIARLGGGLPEPAQTGSDGRYVLRGLPFGMQTLVAKAPGRAAAGARIDIAPNKEPPLDFRLEPGGRVEVTVRDQDGHPVDRARVDIPGAENNPSPVLSLTDANGLFVFQDVAISTARSVMASKTGFQRAETRNPFSYDDQNVARVELTLLPEVRQRLSFSGVVRDESGAPLSGAVVEAMPSYEDRRQRRSAPTGADGAYRLGPLDLPMGGFLRLRAAASGMGDVYKSRPGTLDADLDIKLDFAMGPAHWAGGRVVDETGKPIEGARVKAGDAEAVVTGADGRFRIEKLPGPSLVLLVQDPANGPYDEFPAALDKELEIKLMPPAPLRGRVSDARTGRPVTRFDVNLAGAVNRMRYSLEGQPPDHPDGRFVVNKADRNQAYQLRVIAHGYQPLTLDRVEIPASSDPALEFKLTPAVPVSVLVVDKASGAPVAGASVLAKPGLSARLKVNLNYEAQRSSDPIAAFRLLKTGADGAAVFDMGSGDEAIAVEAPGYGQVVVSPSDRSFNASGAGSIRVELTRNNASISGIVLLDGRPAPGADLTLTASGTATMSEGSSRIKADDAGRFKVSGLSAGEFHIMVMQQFGARSIIRVAKRVKLAEGEDRVVNIGDDAGPSALFGRTLREGKPLPGVEVFVEAGFDWDSHRFGTVSDANGEYKLLGLRPGRYRVFLGGGRDADGKALEPKSSSEELVLLDAPMQRDFDFPPPHRLTVHLAAPAGAPPAFRSGLSRIRIRMDNADTVAAGKMPEKRIDYNGEAAIENGLCVLVGRFLGPYHIEVHWADPSDSRRWGMIDLTAKLDNLDGDADLGELTIPIPDKIKAFLQSPAH